ncbi:MAG: alpha/beta hydrolase [Acidimicrobiales bacterium]
MRDRGPRLGRALVWPFARRYPERLAGVVGVNTPDLPRTPVPITQLLRAAFPDQPPYIVQFQDRGPADWILGRDPLAFMAAMLRGPATKRLDVFSDDVVERMAAPLRVRGAITPPLEYYRNMDRNWEVAADQPAQVTVPALMISAADDPVLTPAMAVGMEERVPDLEKVLIEDCGHWTQQEQPEATNRALIGWLDRLPRWR